MISQIDVTKSTSNSTISPLSPRALVPPCEGAVFQWDLWSPYQTYPFVIHDPGSRFKAGFSLLSVDTHRSSIHVRSWCCTGTRPSASIGACNACQSAGENVDNVKSHAQKPAARMDHTVMSREHFRQKLEATERSLKNEKLKVCILAISQISSLRAMSYTET
jgi:hypothetical protein